MLMPRRRRPIGYGVLKRTRRRASPTVVGAALRSRRRTIETAALVSRSIGLVATVVFAIQAPASTPPALQIACYAGVVAMAVANILALIALRHPGSPRYWLLSALQVALDTPTMVAIVAVSYGNGPQAYWPLLALPIVVAAIRHRLAGALLVWAVTTGSLAFVAEPADLAEAAILHLLVALLSGSQALAYARQLAALQEARRALEHQATHDPLTGLPNRTRLAEHADRLAGRPLAVLLLDLNGFKQVNDTLGHAAGDRLLHEVGVRLRAALAPGDLAGRLGGDEFLVLLPDATASAAVAVAERIRRAVAQPIRLADREVRVGASVGVAARAAGADDSLDALSARADAAMYRDKRARRAA